MVCDRTFICGYGQRTVRRLSPCNIFSSLTFYPTAEEEKEKRCAPSTVTLLSMSTPASTNPAIVEPTVTEIATQSPPGGTLIQPLHPDPGDTGISPTSPPHSPPSGDRDPSPPLPTDLAPTTAEDMAIDPELDRLFPNNRSTPTPAAALAQPLLSTAGRGAFEPDGTCEDFINEAVVAYWEVVPGGVKWIEMVRSYLTLTQRLPAKGVSIYQCLPIE